MPLVGEFSRVGLIWILHVVAFCAAVNAKDPPSKIGIIGGGIGGCSASYFARNTFGESLEIDVFEKDSRLCGRLATVTVGGREYESGGSIIHAKNKYMKKFVKELPGLEEAEHYSGNLGIFNGDEYIVWTSQWTIVTLLRMFWAFGMSLFRISSLGSNFIDTFLGIYDLQDRGVSFENVSALLHAVGGDEFTDATKITSEELFLRKKISHFAIQNLVNPAVLANYGQNASINGFVGAVAMAGIEPGLWSVKGGNKMVCEKLISASAASIVREKVTKVGIDDAGKFTIFTSERPGEARKYDIVILAAPVEHDMYHMNLSEVCDDKSTCPSSSSTDREYRRTVANFVRGKLNPDLFQCSSIKSCPSGILIANQSLFYRSVGLHMPVDYDPETDDVDEGVYKVFTTEPLTNKQRDYLFESHSETATVDWKAYPRYRPPDKLESFVLNKKGLYYTSPIEWAASAMEMSVISAKNSVLLAYDNWMGIPNETPSSRSQKGEL